MAGEKQGGTFTRDPYEFSLAKVVRGSEMCTNLGFLRFPFQGLVLDMG